MDSGFAGAGKTGGLEMGKRRESEVLGLLGRQCCSRLDLADQDSDGG